MINVEDVYSKYLKSGGTLLMSEVFEIIASSRASCPEKYEKLSISESMCNYLNSLIFLNTHTLEELHAIANEGRAEREAQLPDKLQTWLKEQRRELGFD